MTDQHQIKKGFNFALGCIICAVACLGVAIAFFVFMSRLRTAIKPSASSSVKSRVAIDPVTLGSELKKAGLTWESSNESNSNECRADLGCLKQVWLDGVKATGYPVDVLLEFKVPGPKNQKSETQTPQSVGKDARMYIKGNLEVMWFSMPSEADEKLLIQAVDQAYSRSLH